MSIFIGDKLYNFVRRNNEKITIICTIISIFCKYFSSKDNPQKDKKNIFKEFYNDFLKYGTFYAGDIRNAYENSRKDYFVERPPDGDLYAIPRVIEVTEYFPFDYRYGFGIRKLGRFGYERKPNNFWTGNQFRESQQALSATNFGS